MGSKKVAKWKVKRAVRRIYKWQRVYVVRGSLDESIKALTFYTMFGMGPQDKLYQRDVCRAKCGD